MHMIALDQVELTHVRGDRQIRRERLNAEDLDVSGKNGSIAARVIGQPVCGT